jgi:transcription elongation factor Elf1
MDEVAGPDEIKETDIVFDCPYCSKSLAIDYRGAGLTIKCSDCGSDVQVPIPRGMEIGDIDSSGEEQEVRILNLRRSLAAAEDRIRQLESDIEEIQERREILEHTRADGMYRVAEIVEHASRLEEQLQGVTKTLADLVGICRESTAERATPPADGPPAQAGGASIQV